MTLTANRDVATHAARLVGLLPRRETFRRVSADSLFSLQTLTRPSAIAVFAIVFGVMLAVQYFLGR